MKNKTKPTKKRGSKPSLKKVKVPKAKIVRSNKFQGIVLEDTDEKN